MPDGGISTPASNGASFPDTISGDYSVGVGDPGPGPRPAPCSIPTGLSVVVTVTKGDNSSYRSTPHVDLVCKTNTTGTWSCAKPPDLVVGQSDYTISVTITYNGSKTDTKTGIMT